MNLSRFDKLWKLMSTHKFETCEDIIDDVYCTLCTNLMIDPYTSICECHFCSNCIKEYLSDRMRRCPGTKAQCSHTFLTMDENVNKDLKIPYNIARIVVKCPFELCGSMLPLNKMAVHINNCDLKTIADVNNHGCHSNPHPQVWIKALRKLKDELNNLRVQLDLQNSEVASQTDLVKVLKQENDDNRKEIEKLKSLLETGRIETILQRGKIRELKRKQTIVKDDKELEEQRLEIAKLRRRIKKQKQQIKLLEEKFQEKEVMMIRELESLKRGVTEQLDEAEWNLRRSLSYVEEDMNVHTTRDEATYQRMEEMKELCYQRVRDMKVELEEVECDVCAIKNEVDSLVDGDGSKKEDNEMNDSGIITRRSNKEMGLMSVQIRELILNATHDFVWTITNMSSEPWSRESVAFYIQDYHLSLYIIMEPGSQSQLFVNIMQGDRDNDAHWPIDETIVLSLVNQETLKPHKRARFNRSTYGDRSMFSRPYDVNYRIGSLGFQLGEVRNICGVMLQDSLLVTCSLTNDTI